MNERHDTVFTLIHTLQRHMGIELAAVDINV